MGKRRNEKRREKIAKKIQKLHEKLRIIMASDESSDSESDSHDLEIADPIPTEEGIAEDPRQEGIAEDPRQEGIAEDPRQEVDEEILSAMGEIEEAPKGPTALAEIANRWTPILKKGLVEDVRKDLLKKYMPFENIPMIPPKLNPEILAAVSEPVKKRDAVILEKQKQVGAALAALGQAIQLSLQKGDKIEIVKNINDAAKILCDNIYWETLSRRLYISSVINKEMKDSLDCEADSFLFGSNLSEMIKNTKAIQKSVQDLKVTKPPTNKSVGNRTKTLNWRAPPRHTTRNTTGGKRHPPKFPELKKQKQPFRSRNFPPAPTQRR